MSFWMVGNDDAPPNANRMVAMPRKSVLKVGDWCVASPTVSL